VFRSSNPRELRRIGINALERSRSMSLAVEPAAQQLSFSMDVGPLACHLIRDNYGAWTKKRRRGRGIGSGRGRKSGRGQKGMKARAGNKGILQRSGRQSVLEDKVPKSGFHRPRLRYKLLSLHRLQDVISSGRLPVPEDRPITVKDLFDHKILTLRQKYAGVMLMGRGASHFKTPVKMEVQNASHQAIAAVEQAGGSVETVYYSRLTLRAKLKPEKFVKKGQLHPRPALPPPKLMRDVYMSEAKRGYLRDLKPGEVVRPHEHPSHVDLSLKVEQPRYPGWKAAKKAYDARSEADAAPEDQ